MRPSTPWRLFLTAAASAIAAFVITFGALYRLEMIRGRTPNAGASVAPHLDTGMEDVILAASQRLSDMGDDKLSLARPKNEQKPPENEQLLKQLKGWMDNGAKR
jgi:hypothetical protein